MILPIQFQQTAARLLALCSVVILGGLTLWWTINQFVVAVIGDPQVEIPRATLAAAAEYFPQAGRIQGRFAARLIEAGATEQEDEEESLAMAETAATRAANLGQWNYENYVLLAAIKERRGDLSGAESALQRALQLAPHTLDVHWRAGNFYLRVDKLPEAIIELRLAIFGEPERAQQAFDLLWESTDGDPQTIQTVAHGKAEIAIAAAQFLLTKARYDEARKLFAQADQTTRLNSPRTKPFLDALISAQQISAAYKIWSELNAPANAQKINSLWNGSFEELQSEQLNQFGWNFTDSKYASFGAAADRAKTGRYALKIEFTGIDTTRLSGNIQHLLALQPGQKYRVTGYALTTDLRSTEPVVLALTRKNTSALMATSNPVKIDAKGWQLLTLDFVTPREETALYLEIQRLPKFSFDEPTRGTIWFDDFSLQAIQ